jgi:LPPG:FO 2-phospho-L-lactate transferase
MKVVALAGGVGGAKLAEGLSGVLPSEDLVIVVNTGDDFDHFGLHICPDLDTVCYNLAGLENPATGWGRAGESWIGMEIISQLGGPTWFHLGDRDLGLHLERTRRLRAGEPLSQVTADFCKALGIRPRVLPMSDQPTPTWVCTSEGDLPFQEYFVHQQCKPVVRGFRFEGMEAAQPAPGVIKALDQADCVVICPSNPFVSIGPILAVPGVRAALAYRRVIAISPIVAGKAVKGPAAKMFFELGNEPSANAVAQHYRGLLSGFVFDQTDINQQDEIQALGIETLATNTLMKSSQDRRRLAGEVLSFARALGGG